MLSITPVSVPKESGKAVGEKVTPPVDIFNADNWISIGLSIIISILLPIFYFIYNYYATMVLCYIFFCVFAFIVFNNNNRLDTRYIFASNLAITLWLYLGHLPSPAIFNTTISKYNAAGVHLLTSLIFFKSKSLYLTMFQILLVGFTPIDRAKIIGEKETIIKVVFILIVWFFELKQTKPSRISFKRIESLFMTMTPLFKSPMYISIIYAVILLYTSYKLTPLYPSSNDETISDEEFINDNSSSESSSQQDEYEMEDIEQPSGTEQNNDFNEKPPDIHETIKSVTIEEPKKEDKKTSSARTVYSRSQGGVLQLPIIKKDSYNQKNNLAPGYYGMAKLDKNAGNNILQNNSEIKKEEKQINQSKPTILIESLEKAYRF